MHRRIKTFSAISAALCVAGLSGNANAHPEGRLLTQFDAAERLAYGDGVSIAHVNGVHLYGASARPAAASAELETSPRAERIEIELIHTRAPFRHIRRLRTQGFFSGTGPQSRRYTQGFFSGR